MSKIRSSATIPASSNSESGETIIQLIEEGDVIASVTATSLEKAQKIAAKWNNGEYKILNEDADV